MRTAALVAAAVIPARVATVTRGTGSASTSAVRVTVDLRATRQVIQGFGVDARRRRRPWKEPRCRGVSHEARVPHLQRAARASWPEAIDWAVKIDRLLAIGGVSAVDYLFAFFGNSPDAPISISFRDGRYAGFSYKPVYWITGQYSRFVRPGSIGVLIKRRFSHMNPLASSQDLHFVRAGVRRDPSRGGRPVCGARRASASAPPRAAEAIVGAATPTHALHPADWHSSRSTASRVVRAYRGWRRPTEWRSQIL